MEKRWGRHLGRYEIMAELGRGAMGVVYKARDPKIDRFVAVKAISLPGQNPEEEREYRARFVHEAQAAGRLLHPGIVAIFDTGEDPENRIAYIVMEYIPGQSLDRLLSGETKKLPVDDALRLAEELAEALDHAHGQGVVHRDMKPANILVTPEGHAKIADFGIAKLNLANQTVPGQALGTPAYMSPEQLEGEPVDSRSDLFSLGAILYRMVTGYGPFQGNSTATVCFKVTNRDPLRATALDPDLPSELDAVIARAMAKDPAQRYQCGREFARDLHELRARGQAALRDPRGASWFAGTSEGIIRSDGDVAADVSSVTLVPDGGFGRPWKSGREIPLFIPAPASFWRRTRVARAALMIAVVAVAVVATVFVYREKRSSRSPSPIASLATLAVNAGPSPAVSVPPVVNHAGRKAPKNKTPSKIVETAPSVAPDSSLDLRVEHRFPDADLSLWIDDKLAYDRPLHGQSKTHWNPFRADVREKEVVPIASGKHSIRVRVRSAPEQYEQSATVLGNFAKGHPTILQINFERQGQGMRLVLR